MQKSIIIPSILFVFLFGVLQGINAYIGWVDTDSWSQIIINKKDVGILPTSPFYFLKEWGRGIRKFFTFDQVKKAELELKYADEKLIETAKVVNEKCTQESCDKEALDKALNNYLESQKRLIQRIQTLDKKNPNTEKLLEKAFQRVIQHTALFDELKQKNIEPLNELSETAYKVVTPSGKEIIREISKHRREIKIPLIEANLPYPSQETNRLKTLEVITRISEELPEEEKETKEVLENTVVEMAQEIVAQPAPTDEIKEIVEKIQPITPALPQVPTPPEIPPGLTSSEAWYSIENVPFEGKALKKVLIQIVEPKPVELEKVSIPEELKPAPPSLTEPSKPATKPVLTPLPEPEKIEIKRMIEEKLKAVPAQPVPPIEMETIPPSPIIPPPPVKEVPPTRIEVPKAVCPLITPDCGNSKEECLKAAKSLEEKYPGCQYTKICETSCKYPIEFPSLPTIPPVAKGCYIGGCSGEICSDQPGAMSPCIYKPEFACYKTARCERQADGNCGWTMTLELKECLEKNKETNQKEPGSIQTSPTPLPPPINLPKDFYKPEEILR